MTRYNALIWRSLAGLGVVAATLMTSPVASLAQTTANEARPLSSDLVVPTTKLLAIGSFTAKATPSLQKSILPAEVRATVRLYLDGKIDQWYLQQDQSGVVFVMNLTDPQEARAPRQAAVRPSRLDGIQVYPARSNQRPSPAFDRYCEIIRSLPNPSMQ
jgi:hypothetical protein